jgi:hypothetical protein
LFNKFNFSSEAKAKAKAAKYSANPLFHRFAKSLIFSLKDGSTTASTNTGKLFLLSKIQLLINIHLENIIIIFFKVPTDKCIEHSFNSIRAKMAELEPIEELELLHTTNIEDIACVRVSEAKASEVPHALAAPHASAVPHANANASHAKQLKSANSLFSDKSAISSCLFLFYSYLYLHLYLYVHLYLYFISGRLTTG